MSLVFDEYGRPFIIVRGQEGKSRKKGTAWSRVLGLIRKQLVGPCRVKHRTIFVRTEQSGECMTSMSQLLDQVKHILHDSQAHI